MRAVAVVIIEISSNRKGSSFKAAPVLGLRRVRPVLGGAQAEPWRDVHARRLRRSPHSGHDQRGVSITTVIIISSSSSLSSSSSSSSSTQYIKIAYFLT